MDAESVEDVVSETGVRTGACTKSYEDRAKYSGEKVCQECQCLRMHD